MKTPGQKKTVNGRNIFIPDDNQYLVFTILKDLWENLFPRMMFSGKHFGKKKCLLLTVWVSHSCGISTAPTKLYTILIFCPVCEYLFFSEISILSTNA